MSKLGCGFLSLLFAVVSSAYAQEALITNISLAPFSSPTTEEEKKIIARGTASIAIPVVHDARFNFSLLGSTFEGTRYPAAMIDGIVKDTSKFYVRASRGSIARRGAPLSEAMGEYLFVTATNKLTRNVSFAGSFTTSQNRNFSLLGTVGRTSGLVKLFELKDVEGKHCDLTSQNSVSGSKALPRSEAANAEPVAGISSIRLLAAYTNGVLASYDGDEGGVVAKINSELVKLNNTFLNSGLQTKVELACDPYHLTQQGIEAVGASIYAMEDGDGMWDDIHELRQTCQADLVHIFVGGKEYNGGGGFGLIPPEASATSARWGFAASFLPWLPGVGFSPQFTHEVGHNFGAGHANTNAGDASIKLGLFKDSKGYRFFGSDGVKYKTIMAYAPGKEMWGFSNPDITYLGTPTGVKDFYDNARVVKLMTPIISTYRYNLTKPDPSGTFSISLSRSAGIPYTHVQAQLSSQSKIGLEGQYVKVWRTGINEEAPHKSNIAKLENGSADIAYSGSSGAAYVSLYPSRYVKSSEFVIPDLSSATITIQNVSSTIATGKVNSKDLLNISGNWLGIYYYNDYFGDLILDQVVHPDIYGNFIFLTAKKGNYWVQFPYGDTIKKSNTISAN